jgi:hypothetical protein
VKVEKKTFNSEFAAKSFGNSLVTVTVSGGILSDEEDNIDGAATGMHSEAQKVATNSKDDAFSPVKNIGKKVLKRKRDDDKAPKSTASLPNTLLTEKMKKKIKMDITNKKKTKANPFFNHDLAKTKSKAGGKSGGNKKARHK